MRCQSLALVLLLALPAVPSVAAAPAAGAGTPAGATARVLASLQGPTEGAFHAAVENLGGRALEDFPFIHVVLADVPTMQLPLVRALPGVANLYPEEHLTLLLSSSRPAVRVTQGLWDSGASGSGVAVAVVDSGIDEQHPGLAGRVAASIHVDGNGLRPGGGDKDGHGTHIAGIIAGDGSGSSGARHAGMAPQATLVAIDISSSFTTTNAVRAFEWLHDHARENGVRIVSNSWGREKETAVYDPDDPVLRASDALVKDGLVVVFSAGNRGGSRGTLTVEGQNPNVITVGASDDDGRVEAYSSRGPAKNPDGTEAAWTKPDLLAPGTSITSARANTPRGEEPYVTLNGTSMAAPHVAGIAALMLSANPRLAPAEVKDLLLRTARDRGAAGLDNDSGAGFVDAQAAVQAARGNNGPAEPTRQTFSDTGQVAPAAGLLPGHGPTGKSEVRQPLLVPPGAVGLEFAWRWDDPRSAFTVTLERGTQRFGPYAHAQRSGGWNEIRVRLQEPLEAGSWDIVARPQGAMLTSPHYQLDGTLLVQTALVRSSMPLPGGPPGAFPSLLGATGQESLAPWAAGVLVAVALALAWRRYSSGLTQGWNLGFSPPPYVPRGGRPGSGPTVRRSVQPHAMPGARAFGLPSASPSASPSAVPSAVPSAAPCASRVAAPGAPRPAGGLRGHGPALGGPLAGPSAAAVGVVAHTRGVSPAPQDPCHPLQRQDKGICPTGGAAAEDPSAPTRQLARSHAAPRPSFGPARLRTGIGRASGDLPQP